jgi:hypothetical protein
MARRIAWNRYHVFMPTIRPNWRTEQRAGHSMDPHAISDLHFELGSTRACCGERRQLTYFFSGSPYLSPRDPGLGSCNSVERKPSLILSRLLPKIIEENGIAPAIGGRLLDVILS